MNKKIKVFHCPLSNANGSAIVMALVVLMVLTIAGFVAIRTSNIELLVAGNDVRNKITFYAADGGTETGIELVEQNIEERSFGSSTVWGATNIFTHNFWENIEDIDGVAPDNNIPTVTNRDVEIPNIGGGDVYLKMYGNTQLSEGSGLQLAAGYEGKGKGLAGGGAFIVYDIRSFASAPMNSRARVMQQWLHLI